MLTTYFILTFIINLSTLILVSSWITIFNKECTKKIEKYDLEQCIKLTNQNNMIMEAKGVIDEYVSNNSKLETLSNLMIEHEKQISMLKEQTSTLNKGERIE